MDFPDHLKYLESHEYVKVENGEATIGLTAFALEQLSDLVYVDLPEEGDQVTKGESFGEIESVKAVSDMYAPVSGTVKAVNQEAADNPESLKEDPYGSGWMIRISLDDESQLGDLLDAASYQAKVQSEAH